MARYTVDLSDLQRKPLTIGETRDMSRIGGLTIGEMQAVQNGDLGNLPMAAMVAVVYVLLRRRDPRFSEADLNRLEWDDIDFVMPDEGAADGAADDPPVPLAPLRAGERKPSGRSVASGR